MVKGKAAERVGNFRSTGGHRDAVWPKRRFQVALKHVRGSRREFGRLDDNTISGRERSDKRSQDQVQRVVPWADD